MRTIRSFRGKINKYDIAFLAGALIGVGLLVYKAFFSVGFDDEGLFIINPLRFARGDRMLVDDWHVSQLSAFLSYPFIGAFYHLTGDAEGLILFSRIAYISVKTVVSVAVYLTLRSYGKGAVAASLLFLLRESVWFYFILYYNTELLLFGQCLTLLFFSSRSGRPQLKAFFIGVFLAMCVIACPYTAVLFLAYTVAVAVSFAKRRKTLTQGGQTGLSSGFSLLTGRGWLTVSAGIAFVAVLFFAFILRNNSFGEIVRNLPLVFYDDEYRTGVLSGLAEVFTELGYHLYHVSAVIPVWASIIGAVIFAAAAFDKGRMKRRGIYTALMFSVCLFGVIHAYAARNEVTAEIGVSLNRRYESLIFGFFGVHCYLLTKNRDKRVFWYLFIPGVLLTVLRTMESDMFYSAGDMIAPVALTGATLMILQFFDELKNEARSKAWSRGAAVLAVLFFAIQFCYRFDNLRSFHSFAEYEYGDNSITEEAMSVKLSRGPMKGLHVSEKDAKIYNDTLADLDRIRSERSGPIMVPDEDCWIYMYLDDMPMGSYSGYIVSDKWVKFDRIKMMQYYEYHPERYPTAIYIPYYSRYFADQNPILEDVMHAIESDYSGETQQGLAGYILYTE